jgi:hypothetical protein
MSRFGDGWRRRCAVLVAATTLALGGAPSVSSASLPEFGGVVYFSDPDQARIRRYDVATRSWLAPVEVPLPLAPVLLAVDGDAIFAARDGEVFRIPLEGGAATPFLSSWLPVSGLAVSEELLFVTRLGGLVVLDKSSGEVLDEWEGHIEGPSVARSARRLFAASGPDLLAFDYSEVGSLSDPIRVETGGSSASETWVSPDEAALVTAGGRWSNAVTLAFESHLQGRVEAIAFHGGRKVVLRGDTVYVYGEDFEELGRREIGSFPAADPVGIFVDGEDLLLFERWGTVRIIALADVLPAEPAPEIDPAGFPHYEVDALTVDERGVLYLLDRRLRHVFRWSAREHRYLENIRLVDAPVSMAYEATRRRLYLGYSTGESGMLRYVDLDDDLEERPLRNVEHAVRWLAACGEHLVGSDGSRWLSVYDHGAAVVDEEAEVPLGWPTCSVATHRIYAGNGDWIFAADLSPAGMLGEPQTSDFAGSSGPPLWVSPDGSRVLTRHGIVHDGESLEAVGALPMLGGAAWADFGTYTLREVGSAPNASFELTRRDADLAALASFELSGRAEGLVSDGQNVFVVLRNGALSIRVLTAEDRDGDGRAAGVDAFPDDPQEWRDRDGDSVGDHGDQFPDDATEWLDRDDDGVGDNADAFPLDPEETSDLDGDGVGDRSDPFPLGSPILAVSNLDGEHSLRFPGLGVLRAPLGGSLGLLEDGVFSLCDESGCLFGLYRERGRSGRRFELFPDPEWVTSLESSLEQGADSALEDAFQRPVTIDAKVNPSTLRFTLTVDRRGLARLRLRLRFSLTVDGAPQRFRRLPVAWIWQFEPALVAVP